MADSNKIQELFSALMESNNSVREHVKNKSIKLENKKTATKPITENVKSSSFLERALESMTPGAVYEDDNNEVMDDVIDNVAVVTDPEKSVDDLEVRADAVQDAIEDTPEGEEAFSDEYVGDKIYACPICGESFFADDAYHEGDICPICKAEPSDGFLSQGTVVANTEAEESKEVEPVGQEASEEEIPVVGVDEPEEGAEEEEEEEEEKAEESSKAKENGETLTENMVEVEDCDNITEDLIPDLDDAEIEEWPIEECDDTNYAEVDEKSFECMMNEFLHDNYKNSARSLKVNRLVYNESSDKLRAHCTVTLKEGTTRKAIFEIREIGFLKNTAKLVANETTGLFKVEKTHRPFLITAKTSGKMVTFESMKYRFQSTHPKVGAVMVEGVARNLKKKETSLASKKFKQENNSNCTSQLIRRKCEDNNVNDVGSAMNQIKNMMNTDTTVNKTVLITTPYKGTTLNLKVTYYPSYANAYIFRHNIDKEEITSLHKLENKINEMLHWTEYINEKLSGKLTLIEMDIDIYNCGDNVMVVHYNFNSMTGKNIFEKDVNVTNVIIRPNLNDLLDVSNELERKLNKSNA